MDFEYNGYQFSMPGGGVLLLSELFEQLHIEENVADVEDVTFTDYSLMQVEKLDAGSSYRLFIDTFEGFTNADLEEMMPNTVISADKLPVDRVVKTDNWLLTSLKPFNTPERLSVTMKDGSVHDIYVTDAMETNSDGSVKMQSVATVRTSVSKKVTQTEQERDASFDINMGVLFTKSGLEEFQNSVRANGTVPALVYDFSSVVTGSPIDGMITGGTFDLKDDGVTVGTLTIDPAGKAIIQYTDSAYVLRKTAIAANITITVGTNEQYIPVSDTFTWEFPNSNSVTVHYKKDYTTEAKKYQLQGDGSTGYTATYTAKFTSTSDMDSLKFTDQLGSDDLQTLDGNSIRITKDGQDVTSQWTKNATSKGFTLENTGNPGKGEYVVTYNTHITAEQYQQMQEGTQSWENNTSTWNLNGEKEIPGGDTSFTIDKPKPPEPPATVTKDSDKEDQEVQPSGEINYTVRYESQKLNGLTINDKMTDVQILDPSSVVIKIDGQVITTPSGFVNYYNDNAFNPFVMTDVFNYTFPEDGAYPKRDSNYVVEVTYKTTLIDQATAKANNIFDGVSVKNTATESRSWSSDTTTSTVTYDKEIIHTVDKDAQVSFLTEDGKWAPGATVTYTIKVGDGTTDLSGVRVVDKMTGLQKLNNGSVEISYGNNTSYTALSQGIVYDFDQEFTTNTVDVLDFVLPQSAGYGPVYIRYTTTLMTQEQATELGIYDLRQVNNNVNVGDKGHDGTSGNVPYEEEPKFPVSKTVEIDDDQKEESGSTKLGGRVNYHLSFGDANTNMAGVKIRDEMTDVQKLVGDVVVRLPAPLAQPVTLQDGTVLPAGTDHFVMPTSSSVSSDDGVVWAAWLDNGQYDINSYVRVFYYTFPEGIGNGPILVDYAVDVIDEEEAKNAGINDTQNAYNTAYSGNNQVTTEYPVDFPKNMPHNPTARKQWVAWDFANKAVKWDIIVDKTADSAYPVTNVKVTEKLTNMSYVNSSEINGTGYGIKSWEIDMVGAVLETASGNHLVMGEDYEIYKGGLVNDVDTEPYFLIYNLTEPVTIHLTYATPLSIIDGYVAHNCVTLNDGTDNIEAHQVYNAPHFTVAKTGEIVSTSEGQEGLKNRVIKWTVYINPTRMKVEPDPQHVTFSDALPEGMTLINADQWENHNTVDSATPSIQVVYQQWKTYYVNAVPDANNYISGINIEPDVPDTGKVLNEARYEVYYYTYIDDAEWERITSSANGSKTYDNIVTIEAGDITETGETEVTIQSSDYISKIDNTQEGTYTGVDGQQHTGVIGEDGFGSDYLSYRIEINSSAAALNRVEPLNPGDTVTYDPITLTDRIDTNMDFDPSTLKIYTYGPEGTKADKAKPTSELIEADTSNMVISYNDDTRVLAIAGLADKTAYRIEYKNKVRTQGTDTFTNTATLTGGGSHSSTITKTHKFENVTDEGQSYDMELDLHKIKETDITQSLSGVTFELHKMELAIDTNTLSDEDWEQLYTDTNSGLYSDEMLENFKKTDDILLDTITTGPDGIVKLPQGDIAIQPKTVYYWIETANANPDYEPERVPHYFTLYPDKEIVWNEDTGKYIKVLLGEAEKTKAQHIAWALDNAFQKANDVIVASMSSGVTWSVNNLEKKYTTISATKTWEGDANNLFETRPDQGIKLTLYQKLGENGEWVVYNPRNETPRINMNPVTIRGSKYSYTDANGKVVMTEEWPKANWIRLPAYQYHKEQIEGAYIDVIDGYYYYKVVEEPVENYTTTYTTNNLDDQGNPVDPINDGIKKGTVAVTNTYIPPTTSIGVHKTFHVASGTNLPEQIVVNLYQIRKDAEGTVYPPVDYGMTKMLSATNEWTEVFKGLPTRDGEGNSYAYTVVEDTDALEDAGYEYTLTEYIPDGQEADFGGLVSGTIEIVNHGPGSLKIEKNVTINSVPAEVGDSGADGTYTFHVMRKVNDELVEITDTYENGTPKSPVTITIENGASNYAMVTGLDAGDYYIHEDEPTNGTSLTGGNDVKVVVVGGVDDPDAVNVGSFTNNIDKTRVKVHKTWVNANRDAEGNIINGTNHEWPRGMTVQMELRKVQDGQAEHVKVDTPTWYSQNNKTWSDTIVLNAVRQFGVFDNLDELEDGWIYVVDETIIGDNPERFEAFIGEVDEDGNIEIVNAEKTQALFTKKWENTSNESGAGNYKRPNLKISFRLKQFYVNAAGEKVETAASAAQTGIFAPKTIAENTVLNETDGDVTITKEATTGAEWNVLWNNLPAEGEEAGTAVTYSYEVEELGVTASDTDVKADYDTTYSDDKLTVTNRYNKATSAAVEKAWSDDKAHNDVNVTMTLYKSYIAYDGTGSLYSANVQVDNWKDTNNNAASAPTGADDKITVTIKKESTGATVETFDLTAANSWTHTTGNVLRKGTEYVVSWEAANGVKGAELLSAINDQIKLTGTVAAKANTIMVSDSAENQRSMLSTASSSVTLTLKYYIYGSPVNITVDVDGKAKVSTPVVTTEKKYGNDYCTRVYTVTGISTDTHIKYKATNGHYIETVELSETASSGSTVSPTGSEDYIVYSDADDQMPADSDLTEVGSVVLNKDDLAGVWSYEWGDLPLSDATSELYYYVKETAISDPSLVVGEPEVEYEFRDGEPRTITRVKITNIVKGGKLEVTKAATFDPTDNGANANKLYSFYVQDETGKYVQELGGSLGDRIKWFTLKSGETVTFPNLPAGKYTVKEDEKAAKVIGYDLAVSGEGDINVVKDGTATANLTNTYTEEKGSLKLAKTFTGLTYDQLTSDQKAALANIYFTVKNASNETVATVYLKTTGSDGMEANLTKTIDNLKPGNYTVVETRPDDSDPSGFAYKETTVTVTGGTGTTDDNSATATVAANQTVTVTFDNEYEPSTGSLKLTKNVTFNGSGTTTKLVDGEYTFNITGPTPATTEVATVVIKVENGVATQYKLNGATSFTNLPSDKYVVISELDEGDYVITEADPGTDMTVSNITGGVDNTANTDARTVTVHVTAGEDAPAVGSKGAAAYTNDRDNLVDIEATKTWLQSDATTELNTTITHAEVTYTLHKKIGRNGTWAVASDVPDYQKKLEVTDTADANAWKTSWTGLDKYSGEDRIYYKVVESDAKVNGISIALPATSEAEAQNYQAVENHDNLTAVVGLTNTLPTTTVSGTKTWNIVSDTIPDNPTLILKRVSAKQGSAVETVTVPDGQLVWSGEGRTRTYTYSDLPKYDDGGYLYTYSVEESQFTAQGMTYETVKGEDGSYAVTPNTTDAPPALYSTTQDGNDIVNTELTTAQVTKQWAGATSETDNKIGSITYQISRTVDGHPDTSYSPENVTVTYAEAVSNNKGWGNTWSNLPAYGKGTYVDNEVSQDAVGKFEYTVAETKFVYDGVTYNVATDGTVTADTQAEGYDANKVHKFLRTSSTSGNTTAITNILDETYLDVIKKWSLNGNPATDDTEDTIPEISFYLYRNDGKIIDSASPTREAKAQKFDNEHQDGAKPFTIQKKPKTGSDTEYEWKLRIDKLEKTGSDGKPYTYWIQEVSVPGYSTSPGITRVNEHQQEVTVGSGDNAAPAESEITITNSKFTVSLPATGGTGTTIFYGAGLSLMLFAFLGFILNARKRSRGEGI